MSETSSTGGLRARKRAATRSAIERAALSLVLEHGYDNVTVDMICEASMVSQRTFFNYFGSKDGVIVGTVHSEPSQEQIDAFVGKSGPGILTDFVELITEFMSDDELDVELLNARRAVLQRTPQLMNAELAKMSELEERFTQVVLARFRSQGRAGTAHELEEEARMVISLAGGVLHYLMRSWSSGNAERSPRDLLRDATKVLTRFSQTELGLEGK